MDLHQSYQAIETIVGAQDPQPSLYTDPLLNQCAQARDLELRAKSLNVDDSRNEIKWQCFYAAKYYKSAAIHLAEEASVAPELVRESGYLLASRLMRRSGQRYSTAGYYGFHHTRAKAELSEPSCTYPPFHNFFFRAAESYAYAAIYAWKAGYRPEAHTCMKSAWWTLRALALTLPHKSKVFMNARRLIKYVPLHKRRRQLSPVKGPHVEFKRAVRRNKGRGR
ncbi:hypothetical protein HY490_04310 [Candidatus Woesearchaeota archaeon]|nr:hypothetical protein [Candidatus Woesearchaeota archaeon]